MSVVALFPQRPARTVALPLLEAFRREPLFAGAAVCLAALSLPTLAALAVDDRTLGGVSVWTKPLKFEAALIVYLATLAWFAGWLPATARRARWRRIFSGVVVACVAAEMIWIVGAAANGVASHFNRDSALMAAVYPLMGALAVTLTSASAVFGASIWRDRASRLNPVFRLSVGLGLVSTFVLTLLTAGYLASGTGHLVGGDASDAQGFAAMGWARDGGDLRVAHFFAIHAMHFVPAAGYAASLALPPDAGRRAVLAFGAAYAAFVAYTLAEAAAGRPFLPGLG